MSTLRLDHIRIFVSDIEISLAFYSKTLGLKCIAQSSQSGYALLDTGPSRLILDQKKSDSPLVGRETGLSLSCDDVEAMFNVFTNKGVNFISGLEKQFWGGWQALFQDPDGNVLALTGH